jgi:hypothetical protein
MERVRRIATWMRALALLGGVVLLAATLFFWASPEWIATTAAHDVGLGKAPVKITPSVQLAGALVALIPVGVGLFALLQVWHLFGDYARGAIFTASATARLRRLAWAILGIALAQVLARTAIGLVLTMHNPPGKKMLVLGLSSNDYILVLFGLLLLAIAWVMVEATRLARENEEFV